LFTVIYLISDKPDMSIVSYWMTVAGTVSGLVASVPGTIDWLAIPKGTRARRVGAIHGLGNLIVLILFGVSWLFRSNEPAYSPSLLALIVSFLGFAVAGVTGWLGGELVDRLGVGVDEGANLNASNSLSGRPASL
jgi:uncharacterized membrane protein